MVSFWYLPNRIGTKMESDTLFSLNQSRRIPQTSKGAKPIHTRLERKGPHSTKSNHRCSKDERGPQNAQKTTV